MTHKLKKNEYECQVCHGIFEKGWLDEDALKEFHELFPDILIEETGMVCDSCFVKMNAYFGFGVKKS